LKLFRDYLFHQTTEDGAPILGIYKYLYYVLYISILLYSNIIILTYIYYHKFIIYYYYYVDAGHIIACCNKLDGRDVEKIALSSRRGTDLLIVSYADIATCLETSFNELILQNEKGSPDTYTEMIGNERLLNLLQTPIIRSSSQYSHLQQSNHNRGSMHTGHMLHEQYSVNTHQQGGYGNANLSSTLPTNQSFAHGQSTGMNQNRMDSMSQSTSSSRSRDRDKGTRGREYERGFDRTAAGGRYGSSGGASRTHQLGAQ